MRNLIETYTTDRATLSRSLPPAFSPETLRRSGRFLDEWEAALAAIDHAPLDRDGQIDRLLFQHHLAGERRNLELRAVRLAEVAEWTPFTGAILDVEAARRRMERVDASAVAGVLREIGRAVQTVRAQLERGEGLPGRPTALRAARVVDEAHATLKHWFTFYDGYDPLFSWWAREPYAVAEKAIKEYGIYLRETIAGVKPEAEDAASIVGIPIGREALLAELAREMIPYTPEELIAIGDREMEWCREQLRIAANEIGCGDDIAAAIEKVKELHVPPGGQPELVRDLAWEAIHYVEQNDLVTVPPLARECWRMEMISAERQKVSPFFLGGEVIQVSYPTDAMPHDQKRMSLRGNNQHFSRATVQHELIPGHHLQLYMADRYRAYRKLFRTPFYIEGWTLHWEMLLWERNFARSPEDRIGMLFWRIHRSARVTFSLRFHCEQMTPSECVDLLIQEVGHEPANAIAEVRRSCGDDYPPLYQAAYLLGGLQMHALYHEQVTGAGKSPRAFHDAVLKENMIPLEILRLALGDDPVPGEFAVGWRF